MSDAHPARSYWSQQAQQNEEKLLKRLMGATDRERSAAKKKQAAELRKAEKRKAEIDSLFMKMYEDWSAGHITEYNFNMLSEKYQTEQQELDARLQQLLDGQKQPFVLSSNHTGERTKEMLFMTTFYFDMHRIGQTIAHLRRERNMTQMQLADEMGVSFQAVSNWERGQSMPDISKLPELAELFDTTIDALLGRHSPLIEKAAENKLDELPEVRVEELTAAAPILPPKQIESLTDSLMGLTDLPDMSELLRFLPTTKVDALLQRRMEAGKPLKEYALFASTNAVDAAARAHEQQGLPIDDIAPFMSTDCVIEIARSRTAAGRSIAELLPFLYENSVNELARQRDALGHSIDDLLPFMSEDAVDAAARAHEQQGLSIDDIAPFMSTDCVIEIARSRTAAGRSIAELLPFLCENSVNELARQRDALGHSIDDFLPFMSADALAEIAVSRLQRGQKITNLLPFVGESLITRLAEAASSKD